MTKTSINFVTVIRFIYRNFAHGGFIFFNKAGWSGLTRPRTWESTLQTPPRLPARLK